MLFVFVFRLYFYDLFCLEISLFTSKGSMDGELAFESTDKSNKPTKTKSSLSRLPSGKRSENVSSDLSRLPRFKKQSLHDGGISPNLLFIFLVRHFVSSVQLRCKLLVFSFFYFPAELFAICNPSFCTFIGPIFLPVKEQEPPYCNCLQC